MRLTGPDAAAQLMLGIHAGEEPQAAFTDDAASGVLITKSSSWWNHRRCHTCGHTFRRGDRALIDSPARTAQHLMPRLTCGSAPGTPRTPGALGALGAAEPAGGAEGTGDRDEFALGLMSTWPPNMPVTRLAPDDWRIPRPGDGRQAPTCLYCGHTFRPAEYVVICPCQPDRPACGAAVHRDPAAGLPCWDRWRPDGTLARCPVTLAPV